MATNASNTNTQILIVGATAGIARALARQLASDAAARHVSLHLTLAGRDRDELNRLAADLTIRTGCTCSTLRFDAEDLDAIPAFFREATALTDHPLAGVVVAHGWLPELKESQTDPAAIRRLIDINYTSAVLLLEAAAAYFEQRKSGWICGISSVAGDRGRQSNYPYGATKAALSCYLQGLRNRLFHSGVHVLTVKPGFTDTSMTWGIVNPKSPINASPEKVARDIARAIRRRRNVIYTPWFWRIILGILGMIPEWLFKRLKT